MWGGEWMQQAEPASGGSNHASGQLTETLRAGAAWEISVVVGERFMGTGGRACVGPAMG